MHRRQFLTSAAASAAVATLAAPASAQAFPTKPITLIMPWPAGSGIDLWHRAMAEVAGKLLGQPVVVENRAGASGTAGPAAMAATAKPDGYTISHIPITIFRLPQMRKVSWDPIKDFTYIIHQSGFLFGTAVLTESPFKTFKHMMDYAKANPGKVTYGSPGAGTSLHIGMEQIAKKAGVQLTHVPFKGGTETQAALLGGHVMAISEGAGWIPHIEAGKMRLLAIWSEKRHPRFPDVPTLTELGYPFIFDSPFGLAGPKGMDPAVVKKLHDAFKTAQADPKARELQKRYEYVDRYMDSATYTKFVVEQVAEQKAAIELLGLAKKN